VLAFPPDWTFIFQIVLFLVLWTFLRRLLFEPNLAVLQNREQRSAGMMQEATQIKAEAEELHEHYRSRLSESRSGTLQEVDAIYREAESQAGHVLDSARAEAVRIVADVRETLERELSAARQDLQARVPDFSREIAAKLLGRPLT
jgi:F-type H+-transporting ATPase subunit b